MPSPSSCAQHGGVGDRSVGQLKRITQKRPQTVPETSTAEALQAELVPHCLACYGGFCASRAGPHGTDKYCRSTDRARCRNGPRPQSQPCSPAGTRLLAVDDAEGNEGLRPGPARASVSAAGWTRRRRQARSGSMSLSTDEASSFDVADCDEYDIDDPRRKSPLSGAWVTRVQKHEKKSKNPFVECMDREQRLTMERQWLLEDDGCYMQEKKKDLRHNATHNRINLAWQESDDLYEKTVFYGSYSMNMYEKKLGQKIRGAHRVERPELVRSSAGRGKRSGTTKKGDSAEVLSKNKSALQGMLNDLEGSAKSLERHVNGEEQAKDKKKKKGFKEVQRRISLSKGASQPTLTTAQSTPTLRKNIRMNVHDSIANSRLAHTA